MSSPSDRPASEVGLKRYARQTLLPQIGELGQERLRSASIAVVGCGALGSMISSLVVRAGVGRVRIIDRDYIELDNLQRQVLFDEQDIAEGLPKAVAAARKLRRANSEIEVEPVVADVNAGSVERLIAEVDLVLDGTDNFETRFLLNDACAKHGVPWVYGGVIGTHGMTMAIVPGRTPCFRCLVSEMPPPGSTPTCDTVGVLGPAASLVASLEVVEGLKILTGQEEQLHDRLIYVDVWTAAFERFTVKSSDCPVCDLGQYDYLDGRVGSSVTTLCGRDAVQVNVSGDRRPAFSALAERLQPVGQVRFNEHMLRFQADPYELTLFSDGRAIIKGTDDEAVARTLYSRYIGA